MSLLYKTVSDIVRKHKAKRVVFVLDGGNVETLDIRENYERWLEWRYQPIIKDFGETIKGTVKISAIVPSMDVNGNPI